MIKTLAVIHEMGEGWGAGPKMFINERVPGNLEMESGQEHCNRERGN